jgi:hypothetical protein
MFSKFLKRNSLPADNCPVILISIVFDGKSHWDRAPASVGTFETPSALVYHPTKIMPCGFLKLAVEEYRVDEMLKGMGVLANACTVQV